MWLSSTAQQAVHAVLCIAQAGEHSPVRVDELASIIGCPRNYLSKTLHILARARVLTSGRGRHGGFSLAAAPEKLTLARVIAPFERAGQRRCLRARPRSGVLTMPPGPRPPTPRATVTSAPWSTVRPGPRVGSVAHCSSTARTTTSTPPGSPRSTSPAPSQCRSG